MKIIEHGRVLTYLQKRGLLLPYMKAKNAVERGGPSGAKLKKRKPLSRNMWYFRITKKYRALCVRQDEVLYVFDIDDHQ